MTATAIARFAAIVMVALLPVYLPIARFDGNPRTKSRIHKVPEMTEAIGPVLQAAPDPLGPEPDHEDPIDWDQPTLCGDCGYEASSARTLALHEAFGHLTLDDIETWG